MELGLVVVIAARMPQWPSLTAELQCAWDLRHEIRIQRSVKSNSEQKRRQYGQGDNWAGAHPFRPAEPALRSRRGEARGIVPEPVPSVAEVRQNTQLTLPAKINNRQPTLCLLPYIRPKPPCRAWRVFIHTYPLAIERHSGAIFVARMRCRNPNLWRKLFLRFFITASRPDPDSKSTVEAQGFSPGNHPHQNARA